MLTGGRHLDFFSSPPKLPQISLAEARGWTFTAKMSPSSTGFKKEGGAGTFVSGVVYVTPTNVFPGNFGLPGLILNGGALNQGVSGAATVIEGSIYANPGSQSYLIPADSLNQNTVSRALVIQAQLTGSGTLVLLNGNSGAAVPVPQPITGTSNNFTGQWIVMSDYWGAVKPGHRR